MKFMSLMLKHRLARALAIVGLGAAALPALAQSQLPPAVLEALAQAQLPVDALAATVLPVFGPGPRWLHQADRAMQPASVMKLVTSIVALDRIGPNHRGSTELWTRAARGGAASDSLLGDLVLRGGADVEFGLPQLWALLLELRESGIAQIDGNIVLDRLLFNPPRPDIGVPPFDDQPEFPYNVVPDALHLTGSLVEVALASDGQTISAHTVPALPALTIDTSELRFTERACRNWDKDWVTPPRRVLDADGTLRVVLQGGFPRHCSQRQALQLIDRNALAERQLRWIWQSLGGRWNGRVLEAERALVPALPAIPLPLAGLQLPAAALTAATAAAAAMPGDADAPRLLARHQARPWGELLREVNKRSDNAYTRMLYLLLGVNAMAAEPGTPTATLAAREVQRWLQAQRIASAGLVLDNGSGLSRSERISPRQLAMMLQTAQQGPWASELMMSLPLAGVDGSMRNRLKASPAGGWARIKTGSLRNVVALAGYVPDPQGRLWAVAAMINHDQASAGRPALDALLDWVARGGMGARAMPLPGPAEGLNPRPAVSAGKACPGRKDRRPPC